MPKYRITGPDGQTYDVSAPDGVSQDEVMAYAQRNYKMAATPAKVPASAVAPGSLASFAAGAGKGFGSGVLTLQQYLGKALSGVAPEASAVGKAGQWLADDAAEGKQKLSAENDQYSKAHPLANGAGGLTGDIAVTLPVGGLIGKGVGALAKLPQVAEAAPWMLKLAKAIETSGVRTGAPLAADASLAARAGDLATRSAGAAINGGASAAISAPDHIERGALIGAALPPSLVGAAKIAKYGANAAKSLVQPLTDAGQDSIAAKIIQKFGEGGPMEINAAELVPGSLPTLAESTGNAGIATLQRGVRDLRPNAFVERETANGAARHSAFDNVAGDANALTAANGARDEAANVLYGKAFAADGMRRSLASEAQAARAPFAGAGLSAAPDDLATPGLRALMARPGFRAAATQAKTLAADHGVQLDDPLQSLQGLHYIKLALDDALNPAAKSAMGRNASSAVMDMRDKLADELTKVSPLYGTAKNTFAEMSQPVNAMEALQSLKLTNSAEGMTLSKMKTAMDGLEKLRSAPGVNTAKSITPEQMEVLRTIHADLLRQNLLGAGKSAGATTFQNISTGNMLDSLMPGTVGAFVKSKIGTGVGQLGKLAYSGSDEAIRSKLADMMLTPDLLKEVLARQQALSGPSALERLLQLPGTQQALARGVPAASNRP